MIMKPATLAFQILFSIAIVIAVVMALLPQPPHTPLDSLGDKFQHSLAFSVLAFLGAGAFRKLPLFRLGERLSFFGAMIEVAQSIPALHRDCDILDWLTDTIAVTVALLIISAIKTRRAVKG